MKIAIIWKNDYPWDVRIEKIALSLAQIGHEVHILCSNNGCKKRFEHINGLLIHRLPFSKNEILNKLISTPFYLNPFWIFLACKIIKKQKIELLIVRDLPLILVGLLTKKFFNIPLILDMAENYPLMYWNLFNQEALDLDTVDSYPALCWKIFKKAPLNAIKFWFIKNPFLMLLVERYAIKKVDHIFVVVEESKERIINIGANKEIISIVCNTPKIKSFKGKKINKNNIVLKNTIVMIYFGFLQRNRGLDTVINSLARIKDNGLLSGVLIKFIVLGSGNYEKVLKEMVRDKQIDDLVKFEGWIMNDQVSEYIDKSDIGIIPHLKSSHTKTTIPNKLFDFMAHGKPVLVTDVKPMKRIVEEADCGIVFKSRDENSFINALNELILNPNRLIEMGENGRKMVEKRYNWDYDFKKIQHVINGLTAAKKISDML